MAKQTKKHKLPADDTIIENKSKLASMLDEVTTNPAKFKTKKDTIQDKLMLIKDELEPLKDKKIPYSTLKKLIEESVGLKVSEQTLRHFCQTQLGFPKRETKEQKQKKEMHEMVNKGVEAMTPKSRTSSLNDISRDFHE